MRYKFCEYHRDPEASSRTGLWIFYVFSSVTISVTNFVPYILAYSLFRTLIPNAFAGLTESNRLISPSVKPAFFNRGIRFSKILV